MTYSPQFIDEHRHINVDDRYWLEPIIDEHNDVLTGIGLSDVSIGFSGFGSQGDGACFAARVFDFEKFINHVTGSQDSWPVWRALWKTGGLHIRVTTSGRYSHEYSMTVDIAADRFTYGGDAYHDGDDDAMHHIHEAWDKTIDAELKDFDIELTDWCRSYARSIFRDLEQSYDYLTSDEAVIETLEINKIEEEDDLC
jgi:hypothetical protein